MKSNKGLAKVRFGYLQESEHRSERKTAPIEPKKYIKSLLPHLAKHQVKELTYMIRQYYITKPHNRRTPKYRTINKVSLKSSFRGSSGP